MNNLDVLSKRLYGRTRSEAWRDVVCVRCGTPVNPDWEEIDMLEWKISATCPSCWDELFPEEDEEGQ